MSVEAIIARYGLAAVFVGAGLEGETVVVASGILAHRGTWPLAGAMAAAVLGSFTADQLFFLIGRRWRNHPRVRRIMARRAFAKALAAFERRPTLFILGFRFLYGVRTISPIAIGTTNVSQRRFMVLNVIAALIWGVGFSALGYWFGQGLDALVARWRPTGGVLLLAGAAAFAAVAVFLAMRHWRGRSA